MKIPVKSAKFRGIAIALSLVIAACMLIFPPEYVKGSAMGWAEGKFGRQEIKTWGYDRPEWFNAYKTLLLNKYKVYIHSVSTGNLTWKDRRYYEGYNDMMKKSIIKKYSKDIFTECEKEAEAQYSNKTPAPNR